MLLEPRSAISRVGCRGLRLAQVLIEQGHRPRRRVQVGSQQKIGALDKGDEFLCRSSGRVGR